MTASRIPAVIFCLGLVLTAGCSGGYGKKLVGTWEGGDDATPLGKMGVVTVEFKADGGMKMVVGPIDITGTYKVVKEDGKVLTVETELTMAGMGDLKMGTKDKDKKQSFTVTFEDDDTITMSPTDKPDPKKLKRKK